MWSGECREWAQSGLSLQFQAKAICADEAAASARPFLCSSLISMTQIKAPARAIS